MLESVGSFGAAGSMVGYLYQVRVALVWAIRHSRVADFSVSLETLDDVSFSKAGEPIAILQTKHSLTAAANLTDLSPELWKTLRVWMVGLASGEVPASAYRILISTAAASQGTACSVLGVEGAVRDVPEAAKRLKHAATTSQNVDLKDAFASFLALDEKAREQLLARTYVVPAQPDADAIRAQLEAELYHLSLHHQEQAVRLVEGWWFGRVVHELVHGGRGISRAEIDSQLSDIQESLKPDSLPISEEIDALMVVLEQLPEFADRPLYKQVELVTNSKQRILNAITSYLRAFRQRSAWTRDDLLFDADLQKYDRRLCEEWQLQREQVFDELGEAPGEHAMQTAGRAVLKWAEDVMLPIRAGVTVPWVCRGSLHMLADELHVGWHPEFEARLRAIIGAADSGGRA